MTKLARLARWEKDLDKCIRCGYCFQHCPIFKATRWETDTPRGKLILLHGLLQGALEPSAYLAEKIFECFHCRRCEKACSSGVRPLQIFTDARADLLEAGWQPTGTVSVTDHERCARCLACLRLCPHEARRFDGEKLQTDPAKCQGCGGCLDACPAEAISIKGFGTAPDELSAQLAKFLDAHDGLKVVTFACSWSSYPGLLHARRSVAEPEGILITACAGRLAGRTVLEAFQRGARGVLLAGCQEKDCEHGGLARAEKRMRRLQGWLGQAGIRPERLKWVQIGFSDPAGLARARTEFMREIAALDSAGTT